MPEPEGLSFVDQVFARIMIATQSGEKKEEFLEAADSEGKLSPVDRETMGAIFDVFVDAVSDNIEKFNPDDPINSAANIVLEHFQNVDNLKEAADTIFKDTGVDLGNITPDKSDDLTQAQMDKIMAAISRGIEGLQNPSTAPQKELTPDATNDSSSLDKGYQQGVDGTAYTTQVNGPEEGGEPNVDFKNGVTVSGLPVGNFFAQNAAPPPEDITLVNARAPETDVTPYIPIISPTVEANQTTQSLV